jgi:hypothetical protein
VDSVREEKGRYTLSAEPFFNASRVLLSPAGVLCFPPPPSLTHPNEATLKPPQAGQPPPSPNPQIKPQIIVALNRRLGLPSVWRQIEREGPKRMPTHTDSIDKIVTSYFAPLTKVPFTYKGKLYEPKALKVSPLLLRGYTCPEGCGGCCPRFSLDYLPDEPHPEGVNPRVIPFDDREVIVYSDRQRDHTNHHCRNLNKENGRCGIYERRPFSCDFELIRTLTFESADTPNTLTQKLFGRGWALKRVDEVRGAMCEMTPVTEASRAEVVRKLKRLLAWTQHFGIETWTDEIIKRIVERTLYGEVVLEVAERSEGADT